MGVIGFAARACLWFLVTSYLGAISFRASAGTDAFAARIPLNLPFVDGDLDAATVEPGEPGNFVATIWWSWTVPRSGYWMLEAQENGRLVDLDVVVYRGTNLASLERIAGGASGFAFAAHVGETLAVQVGTKVNVPASRPHLNYLGFNYRSAAPVPHDTPDSACSISTSWLLASNVGATGDATEPRIGAGPNLASVWFRWRPSVTGPHEMRAVAGAVSFNLAVFETETPPATGSVPTAAGRGAIPIEITAGRSYFIGVDAPNGDFRDFELAMAFRPGVPNDRPELAATVVGDLVSVPYTTVGRTAATSWWRWTAPRKGPTLARLLPRPWLGLESQIVSLPAKIAAFQETETGGLSSVGTTNNGLIPPGENAYKFDAIAGGNYLLRVDTDAIKRSEVLFELVTVPKHVEQRIPLEISGTDIRFPVHNIGAAISSEWNGLLTSSSRWVRFEWRAPTTGTWMISAIGVGFPPTPSDRPLGRLNVDPVEPMAALPAVGEVAAFAAVAGESYRIAVGSTFNRWGHFDFRLQPGASNDAFASPEVLPSTNFWHGTPDLAGTTLESTEPSVSTNLVGSAWYEWTAPESRTYWIWTPSTNVLIEAFTGTQLTNLRPVGLLRNYVSGSVIREGNSLVLPALGGTSYRIRLATDASRSALVDFTIQPSMLLYDSFAQSPLLPSERVVTTEFALGGATLEPGETHWVHPADRGSVWFSFQPPVAGTWVMRVPENLELDVFRGDELERLERVARGVQVQALSENRKEARCAFYGGPDTTYRIRVAGGSAPLSGRLSIELAPVTNDRFVDRQRLTGVELQVTNLVYGSTFEVGEPGAEFETPGGSTWAEWTAPIAGHYVIETPSYAQGIAVYRGASLDTLQLVRWPDAYVAKERAAVAAKAGETFCIQRLVSGGIDDYGSGQLLQNVLTIWRLPDNDHFNGEAIMVTENLVRGGTWFATSDPKEDRGQLAVRGAGSRWWAWRAPRSGGYSLEFYTMGLHAASSAILTGDRVDSLRRVAGAGSVFRAEAGRVYHVLIDGEAPNSFGYLFTIISGSPNDDFENRQSYPVNQTSVPFVISRPTVQPGEPLLTPPPSPTTWWSFQTNRAGIYVAYAEVYGAGAEIEAFAGESLETLKLVGLSETTEKKLICLPSGESTRPGRYTEFYAEADTTYALRLRMRMFSDSYFQFPSSLSILRGPSNDNLEDAAPIVPDPRGSTNEVLTALGLSRQPGEPDHGGIGRSMWWQYRPDRDHGVACFVDRGIYEAVLALYDGDRLESLQPVGHAAAFVPERTSSHLGFRALRGHTYSLALDRRLPMFDRGAWVLYSAPTNDEIAMAIELPRTLTATERLPVSLVAASVEPGEPQHGTQANGGSLWWRWVAANHGLTKVRLLGPGAEKTTLRVYRVTGPGADFGSLVPASFEYETRTQVNEGAGITEPSAKYFLAVDAPAERPTDLTLQVIEAPVNVPFAAAQPLPDGRFDVVGRSGPPQMDPASPLEVPSGQGATWYRWQPRDSGTVRLELVPENGPQGLVVLAGDRDGTWHQILNLPATDRLNPARGRFDFTSGVDYRLAVLAGFAGAGGFRLHVLPYVDNDDFSERISLNGSRTNLEVSSVEATLEPNEPQEPLASVPARQGSVWYQWKAEAMGACTLRLNTSQGALYPQIRVYRGAERSWLVPVGGAYGQPTNVAVTFQATAGSTYSISLDTTVPATQPMRFELDFVADGTLSVGGDWSLPGVTWRTPSRRAWSTVPDAGAAATTDQARPSGGDWIAPSRMVADVDGGFMIEFEWYLRIIGNPTPVLWVELDGIVIDSTALGLWRHYVRIPAGRHELAFYYVGAAPTSLEPVFIDRIRRLDPPRPVLGFGRTSEAEASADFAVGPWISLQAAVGTRARLFHSLDLQQWTETARVDGPAVQLYALPALPTNRVAGFFRAKSE